jgi:RNA polymerase sigma factor (sigma-70 family)
MDDGALDSEIRRGVVGDDSASEQGQNARAAMNAFVRAYQPLLRAFFRNRLGSDDTAAEFAQDTFLRFAQAGYDPAAQNVKALLFAIARNLFFDHLRRLRRERASGFLIDSMIDDAELAGLASADPAPDARLSDRQDLKAVITAIEALPPRCAQVFLMHRIHGKAQKDIAVELGVSLSVVEKHVKRALVHLAAAVGRDGGRTKL